MKTAIIMLALVGVLIAPIACALVVCPAVDHHDCCPKSKTFAACPFDILSSAKAVLPAVVAAVLAIWTTVQLAADPLIALRAPALDDRDLHLLNRVLRI